MDDLFGEKFRTMAGVHDSFAARGIEATTDECGRCERRKSVYPWPLPGFGVRCAMCIVMETTGGDSA